MRLIPEVLRYYANWCNPCLWHSNLDLIILFQISNIFALFSLPDSPKSFINQSLNCFCSQCLFGPDKFLADKELQSVMRLLPTFRHPHIYPSLFAMSNERSGIVIRSFCEKGSLLDILCKVGLTHCGLVSTPVGHLTHYGLVTPYADKDLRQHWLR